MSSKRRRPFWIRALGTLGGSTVVFGLAAALALGALAYLLYLFVRMLEGLS